jgi:hypothetical protein
LKPNSSASEAALGPALVRVKERAELCRHLTQSDELEPEALQPMLEQAEQRAAAVKALLDAEWMLVPRVDLSGLGSA